MTLKELRDLELYQTAAVGEAAADPDTGVYIMECVERFYNGDFGEMPEEDSELNIQELQSGEGHCLGRYKAKFKLVGDIYINSYFSEETPDDLDYNNTLVMYCSEY